MRIPTARSPASNRRARMPEPASSPAPISSDVTDATAECQNPAAVGAFGVVHGYGDERVPSG